MEKRRTPKEIIESLPTDKEYTFIKAPRGELINITEEGQTHSVRSSLSKEREFYEERKGKKHTFLHTHHYIQGYGGSAFPSSEDMLDSIGPKEKMRRVEGIAVKDSKTGEYQGYTEIHRKKPVIPSNTLYLSYQNVSEFRSMIKSNNLSPREYYEELLKLGRDQGFDIRFHPEKGYYFDKETGNYEKKPAHSLEGAVASIIIGFSLLFLLIKVPFTGFIISNSISANQETGLFIISGLLFALIAYFILRKAVRNS